MSDPEINQNEEGESDEENASEESQDKESSVDDTPSESETYSSRKEEACKTAHVLDNLDLEQTTKALEDLQKRLRYLRAENTVFFHFLQINDPVIVEESSETTESRRISTSSSRKSLLVSLVRKSHDVLETLRTTDTSEVVKINLMQRIDLVTREIDEIQLKVNKLNKTWHNTRFLYLSKIEELETRNHELTEALENFEKMRQGPEPLTFQKLVRFMDEWSKKSRLAVDKLRLRHSSLKVQYQKTSAILAHKKLIGENLQEIDFEQLRIENIHLVSDIEKKALLLLELKRMTGAGNLKLSQQKEALLKRLEVKEELDEEIQRIENEIVKSDNKIVELYHELEEVKMQHDEVQSKVQSYSAPEVLDYVRKKAEVEKLKREVKVWMRKVNVKKLALNVVTKQLKKLLNGHLPDPSWLN